MSSPFISLVADEELLDNPPEKGEPLLSQNNSNHSSSLPIRIQGTKVEELIASLGDLDSDEWAIENAEGVQHTLSALRSMPPDVQVTKTRAMIAWFQNQLVDQSKFPVTTLLTQHHRRCRCPYRTTRPLD